jgi:cell division septal protein FtsQ
MKVRANLERNFRRARVKPGRGRRARSRKLWPLLGHVALILLFVYAGYRAVSLVVQAAPLRIAEVSVSGNARLTTPEVERYVRGLKGHSILAADLDATRERLLQSAWIADASLRRVLPSTIEVRVTERDPIGICRLGSRLYLIDRTGTVIDEFGPRYVEFDLPILDGLVRSPRSGKPAIDETRAAAAAGVMDALAGQPIARRVSQIDVGDIHDVVVLLDDDPARLRLGEDHFVERLQAYAEVAQALRDRVGAIEYVDLRFGERLYVKPHGAAGRSVRSGGIQR